MVGLHVGPDGGLVHLVADAEVAAHLTQTSPTRLLGNTDNISTGHGDADGGIGSCHAALLLKVASHLVFLKIKGRGTRL